MTDDRLTALQILMEQLIVERCLMTDNPSGTVDLARQMLAQLADRDTTGRITPGVVRELDETMERVEAALMRAADYSSDP